jgi:hypothetical protein
MFGTNGLHAVQEVSVHQLDLATLEALKNVSCLELKPLWRSYRMTDEDRAVAVSWTIE